MKLSIIIPVYNEEKTILKILERIRSIELTRGVTKEIILIDDCSKDRSIELIQTYIKQNSNASSEFKLIQHTKNSGKGAALRNGFKSASGDFLIIQDADLEYDPIEYNQLLAPILDGYADVVYGSRFIGSKPHRVLNFHHYLGNKFLTFLSNVCNNLNLTDMETCYKLFKIDIIKQIDLQENRFGIEPELTAKIAKIPGIRIYECGIAYYGRTYAEGKKINWKDGVKAIFYILKYRFFN